MPHWVGGPNSSPMTAHWHGPLPLDYGKMELDTTLRQDLEHELLPGPCEVTLSVALSS